MFGPFSLKSWRLTKLDERTSLIMALRKSLRRPLASIQSNRGWGAEYVCPFIDCARVLDSDENAAINLLNRYHQRVNQENALYLTTN